MAAKSSYETVVIGAGIAGVAAGHYLACRYGHRDVLLVDRQQPLSLTTSRSGENYRDYWPQPCMRTLATASIDEMEQLLAVHGPAFAMKETGYLFASRRPGHQIFPLAAANEAAPATTVVSDRSTIARRWPHLHPDTVQVVEIKRAGAIDVQALGQLLLTTARRHGVELVQATVRSITAGRPNRFLLDVNGRPVQAGNVVLATGPFTGQLAASLGLDLPLENVAQRKFVMPDPDHIIPADMAFTICADPLRLAFESTEQELIGQDDELAWLLDEFPAGLHIKPEPGGLIKLGWAYNREAEAPPRWSIAEDHRFPNVVLRGATEMIPGLAAYLDPIPTPVIQYGGYYTRTPENWPLIGPTELDGLYTVAGLSGFGTMVACAAGDLLARHVVGHSLPDHAPYFAPTRYGDPAIRQEMAAATADGQL